MARRKLKSATDQRPFIMVYQDFLESELLENQYQKLVYIYLKKFADSNNQCFPSVKKLSKLTKIGVTKIKQTLVELEKKGVIAKTNRSRSDGGKSSNLYTLYDYAEVWNVDSSEAAAAVAEDVSEAKMIALLKKKGYVLTKEKELSNTEPTKVTVEPSTQLNQFDIVDNTLNIETSQVERYTLEQIKELYEYGIMLEREPIYKADIDTVMTILYDILNTHKTTIRIAGEDKPTMVVIGRLMKLSSENIMYAIQRYQEQTERIKNPEAYMLTLLYKAKEQMSLDIQNKVTYDMNK